MIGPDSAVKGGISSIIRHIQQSELVQMHRIRFLSSFMDYPSKLRKLAIGGCSYFRFIGMVSRKKPDLVHVHTSFGASFYRKAVFFLLSECMHIPLVNHIHGAEFDKFYQNASAWKRRLVAWIYRKAAATIVLSESWKSAVEEIVGDKPVVVLNNFTVMDTALTPYGERLDEIVFMGEVGKRKGAYDLPKIAQLVSRAYPNVRFNICGNGDVEQVRQRMDELGLQAVVNLTGWIDGDAKLDYLRKGRIFLLPTYNEGQPMAILEAMGYGMPIVSTLVGGIPELVVQEDNGYLHKAGDCEGIASSLLKLLGDRSLAERISEANLLKIQTGYTLDVFIARLNEIYGAVVKESDLSLG